MRLQDWVSSPLSGDGIALRNTSRWIKAPLDSSENKINPGKTGHS